MEWEVAWEGSKIRGMIGMRPFGVAARRAVSRSARIYVCQAGNSEDGSEISKEEEGCGKMDKVGVCLRRIEVGRARSDQ